MNQPMSRTRLLLLTAAMTNPFCWLPFLSIARSAWSELKTGSVSGMVFVSDSNGGRSAVPSAKVRLEGPSGSKQAVTDEWGKYSFAAVGSATYQIVVTARGLTGSSFVTVVSGTALDVPIQLRVKDTKQTATVTASSKREVAGYLTAQRAVREAA